MEPVPDPTTRARGTHPRHNDALDRPSGNVAELAGVPTPDTVASNNNMTNRDTRRTGAIGRSSHPIWCQSARDSNDALDHPLRIARVCHSARNPLW